VKAEERESVSVVETVRVKRGRQDPKYVDRERTRNAEAMRKARQDPEYAEIERTRNAVAKRKARQDPK